jgi:putative membrane protein
MLLVLCVDLDDDLGRKAELETPVVGRGAVEGAAVALATADPEDSDTNVLFQGIHTYDEIDADGGTAPDSRRGESVEVAAVTGTQGGDVAANRAVGEEIDEVLSALSTSEEVRAIVITDGAQDESVLPVIRSRIRIDGVRRVVVRQAQDLESIYYTMKQVLADPETRGTVLVPLGILLLIYPFVVIAQFLQVPGAAVLGLVSALLGLYSLFRGLGLEESVDAAAERIRVSLYAGRVTIITYVVAAALLLVGGVRGLETVRTIEIAISPGPSPLVSVAAFIYGGIVWFAAAGVTSSLGQITDEYLSDRFRWRHLNAPFYVLAISIVLYAVTGFVLPPLGGVGLLTLTDLAVALTVGTILGVLSTLTFAIAESRLPTRAEST